MTRFRFAQATLELLAAMVLLAGCVIQPVPGGTSIVPAAGSSEGQAVAATATPETASQPEATVEATATIAPPEPTVDVAAAAQEFIIPEPVAGKFNVAFVYSSPIGDGGWTYAHEQGRQIIETYLGDRVHTGYVESVPEGAVSEVVIRQLAEAVIPESV